MKSRCLNFKNKKFKDYGGRGILICPEWSNDYIKFRDWALSNEYKKDLVIDRRNPDGNYEPFNCRFLTIEESNRNKQKMKIKNMGIANEIRTFYNSGYYTQKELAEKFNISFSHISNIINNRRWVNNC